MTEQSIKSYITDNYSEQLADAYSAEFSESTIEEFKDSFVGLFDDIREWAEEWLAIGYPEGYSNNAEGVIPHCFIDWENVEHHAEMDYTILEVLGNDKYGDPDFRPGQTAVFRA